MNSPEYYASIPFDMEIRERGDKEEFRWHCSCGGSARGWIETRYQAFASWKNHADRTAAHA